MTARVVITGLGLVTPLGNSVKAFWDGLTAGRSGVTQLTGIATARLTIRTGAQVTDFRPETWLPGRHAESMDRVSQFALCGAIDAVRDAGLEFDDRTAMETATVIGIGLCGTVTLDDAFKSFYGENSQRVHPLTLAKSMSSAAPSHISMHFGLHGPTFTVASACASGAHAIGQAYRMVASREVPVAIAGGAEAPLTPGTVKAWEALRILSPDVCRPFSRNRRGLVIGEGAAVFVLEEREAALGRGARIYGEIRGYGYSADAGDLMSPDSYGASLAIRRALKCAALDPGDIGYVNAHGTGTRLNDNSEAAAIQATLREPVPVSSLKGALGHSFGAAGAIEAAATVLALRHKVLPPTINFEEADPECPLDAIPNHARDTSVRFALSNSFAFGGLNAVLAVASPEAALH